MRWKRWLDFWEINLWIVPGSQFVYYYWLGGGRSRAESEWAHAAAQGEFYVVFTCQELPQSIPLSRPCIPATHFTITRFPLLTKYTSEAHYSSRTNPPHISSSFLSAPAFYSFARRGRRHGLRGFSFLGWCWGRKGGFLGEFPSFFKTKSFSCLSNSNTPLSTNLAI